MKTLFISDLDGTLLNSEAQLSDFTAKTLNDLIAEGIIFSYATARSFYSSQKITAALRIDFPVITYNGAFVVNHATGEILLSNYFSQSEAQYIQNVLAQYQIHPFVFAYVGGVEKFSFYSQRLNVGKQHFLHHRKGDIRRRDVDRPEAAYEGNSFNFSCIGEETELAPAYDLLKTDPRFYCVFSKDIYSGAQWLEILPVSASKAHAALWLKQHLGCDRIISFGDGKNDLPLFEISDECYAVENAAPELKEKATAVIASNNHDGVVKWLKEHADLR